MAAHTFLSARPTRQRQVFSRQHTTILELCMSLKLRLPNKALLLTWRRTGVARQAGRCVAGGGGAWRKRLRVLVALAAAAALAVFKGLCRDALRICMQPGELVRSVVLGMEHLAGQLTLCAP